MNELCTNSAYGNSLATGHPWIEVDGHRGLFARLALMAGDKQVYSYEPRPGNAMVYSWNCRGWPAIVERQACVADGKARSTPFLCKSHSQAHVGARRVAGQGPRTISQ